MAGTITAAGDPAAAPVAGETPPETSPDEEVLLNTLESLWRRYQDHGQSTRHLMGDLINRQYGPPTEKQARGKRVLALAALRLSLSEPDLSRMRWLAFFKDVEELKKLHPPVTSWSRFKERLPGLKRQLGQSTDATTTEADISAEETGGGGSVEEGRSVPASPDRPGQGDRGGAGQTRRGPVAHFFIIPTKLPLTGEPGNTGPGGRDVPSPSTSRGPNMQLVINTFGAHLRRQGDRFLVKAKERELAVSAHKVQSILITTGVSLSSDALQLASEHNVDVVFLDRTGQPYGRVWQHRMGSTAAIRRRQVEVAETAEGLELVLGWITAKVRNQREFLDELADRRPGEAATFRTAQDGLHECLERLRGLTGTVDERLATVMGLEGAAGRVYFTCLGRLMPEAYRFEGRSRHPARDGFNGMLNYAYGVLYSLVEKACVCAGLDPFVGLLHTDNYGKKSLVFDLLEPFRILGDRTVVLLFTGRRMKAEHFEAIPEGVALSAAGRAALLESFNGRLDKAVRYAVQSRPGRTRNVKRRDVIRFEAHALANRLLGKADLPRVVETRQLWDEANEVPAAEAGEIEEALAEEEGRAAGPPDDPDVGGAGLDENPKLPEGPPC